MLGLGDLDLTLGLSMMVKPAGIWAGTLEFTGFKEGADETMTWAGTGDNTCEEETGGAGLKETGAAGVTNATCGVAFGDDKLPYPTYSGLLLLG